MINFPFSETQYALRSHIVRNCGKPTTPKTAYNCHVCGLLFDKIAMLNKHGKQTNFLLIFPTIEDFFT
jgi:hypothetical protein